MGQLALAGLIAWGLGLLLTPVIRSDVTRRDWVHRPRADRWSQRTVALMGGIAIYGATLGGCLVYLPWFDQRAAILLGLASMHFLLGFVDDRKELRPHTKLLAQVVTALALYEGGFRFGLPGEWGPWVDAPLTLLWIVGVGNAFNLLDNMDGLCAGIASIAAGFLGLVQFSQGSPVAAGISLSLSGACLGYLRYNRHPATIFMGDCGALFIGFLLAGSALYIPGGGARRSMLSILALPVLIMLAPLLDTCLVTIARPLHNRSVGDGGKDHSSHRLVAVGLSEPQAVKLLYLLGASGGLAALAVQWLDWYLSSLLLAMLLLMAGSIGWHLFRVQVYAPETLPEGGTILPRLGQHRYRRRVVEVMLDTVLIAVGFYAAAALRYEGALADPERLRAFAQAAPIVVASHLIAYFILGVYRGIWRYTSVTDLPRFVRAVLLGLALSLAVMTATGGGKGLSKSLFVINLMTQFGLLAGSRVSVKLLRDRLVAMRRRGDRRVLLVGVGEAAELGIRQLQWDRHLALIGTVGDEPQLVGLRVLDVPILGVVDDLPSLLASHDVEAVILLDPECCAAVLEQVRSACQAAGLPVEMLKPGLSER